MRALWWLMLVGLGLLQAARADEREAPGAGRSIYLEGRHASGEPVLATVQGGVPLQGAAAACVNCHRRSGLGGSEGQSRVRAIAGAQLFSPVTPVPVQRAAVASGSGAPRPAYTLASLARALREGVDPAGRVLGALMPRYTLKDGEVADLQTYLSSLLVSEAPGVTAQEIHFATVIGPGVDPARQRDLLALMQAFFRDRNGGTRLEARRREVGREAMYLAHRRWVLHVWTLDGPPERWRAQLDAHYRAQPVFAVLGGLGHGSWAPVHAFCEDAALPCVFPDIDHPADDAGSHHVLYFSRGLALEAELLARRLAATLPPAARVVQVFRDDESGRLAARALRTALRGHAIDLLDDAPVQGSGLVPVAFWTGLWRDRRPTALVAWLDGADLQGLGVAEGFAAGLQTVYLSASLCSEPPASLSTRAWRPRVEVVSLFEPPSQRERHLARMNAWLRTRQIPAGDARVQANAYLTVTLAGDAVTHIGSNFSRDYFLERIEQMAEVSPSRSIYPRLSLGPGQRFASRGGYILGFAPDGDDRLVPVSDWIVP